MHISPGDKAPPFFYNTPFEKNLDFNRSVKNSRHAILVFSRYIGCSLCQMELMEMVKSYDEIKRNGGEVYFVLQSAEENVKEKAGEMGIQFPLILDPEGKLYDLYGAGAAASKMGLVSFKVLRLIRKAKKEGILHGAYEGNELQLPAVFIVSEDGLVEFAHYGKHAADYPDSRKLIGLLRG